ncbi:T9SS type A sorting domain-containing protein [Mucilaginibacter sp.]|uniref:T9SS type A sorting domain-containing protein n=1 Tax=Mucilaginibacter sp. TaxID=1882438 RepID=UPI003D1438BA
MAGSGTVNLNGVTVYSGAALFLTGSNYVVSGSTINLQNYTANTGLIAAINSATGPYLSNSGTLTLSSSAVVNLSGVYSQIYNTGTISAASSSAFNLSGANSSITNPGTFYAGSSGSACTLNLSGTSTGVFNTNVFVLGSTSVINLTGTTSNVDNSTAGTFTLMSDANGSATLGQINAASTGFTGKYNVQRYMTGNNSLTYRGYRLMSTPVNITSATPSPSGANYIGINTLNSSYTVAGTSYKGAFTGGSGAGFSVVNPNPTIYFYKETNASNNSSFLLGKNVGVKSIVGTTITLIDGTAYNIPVGNGYLIDYIGSTNGRTTGSTSLKPDNATITNVGYINQGNINVNLWYAPAGGTVNAVKLSYTAGQVASFFPGTNMIGNPYASTIDLNQLYADNTVASPSLSSNFYELYNENPGQAYMVYSATGGTSASKASRYIASGQGFMSVVSATNQTLTFKEDQKVYNNSLTPVSSPPLLLVASNNKNAALNSSAVATQPQALMAPPRDETLLAGLHLKLLQDSVTYDECGVYFRSDWSDNFDLNDAYDLDGASPKVYLSTYTADGVRTAINKMGDFTKGKRARIYVKGSIDGNFNLQLEDIQNIDTSMYSVFIIDHLNKDSLDVTRYKTYVFTVIRADTATYGGYRLELAIERKPLPPYELALFTGKKVSDGVLLTWKTYNEGNFTGFTIEKQDGSLQYLPLYTIQSNGSGTYSYTDHNPVAGANIYRLKQNNIDGLISYSALLTVQYGGLASGGVMSVYPNPAHEIITVNLNAAAPTGSGAFMENIYNSMGLLVLQKSVSSSKWSENVGAFKPGAYVIEVKNTNGDSMGNTKFIKYQ